MQMPIVKNNGKVFNPYDKLLHSNSPFTGPGQVTILKQTLCDTDGKSTRKLARGPILRGLTQD